MRRLKLWQGLGLCLIINTVCSIWVVPSIWTFVFFSIVELSLYIYQKHREGLYEQGLIALSPKKLFKKHQADYSDYMGAELNLKEDQNQNDLSLILKTHEDDWKRDKAHFETIVNQIETLLDGTERQVQSEIHTRLQQSVLELKNEQDRLHKIGLELELLQQEIGSLTILDQNREDQRVDKLVKKLHSLTFAPQLKIERRVARELDVFEGRIATFQKRLDRRLGLRDRVESREDDLEDYWN